jgi:hypothetical protein
MKNRKYDTGYASIQEKGGESDE